MVNTQIMKLKIIIAILFLIFASGSLQASSVRIGGYDVEKIVASTLDLLNTKSMVSLEDIKKLQEDVNLQNSTDPLIAGSSLVDFYNKLDELLVKKNIISIEDVNSIKEKSSRSGGVKIGGLNPVVLAALHLDLLVKKNITDIKTAQSILDEAKK